MNELIEQQDDDTVLIEQARKIEAEDEFIGFNVALEELGIEDRFIKKFNKKKCGQNLLI